MLIVSGLVKVGRKVNVVVYVYALTPLGWRVKGSPYLPEIPSSYMGTYFISRNEDVIQT